MKRFLTIGFIAVATAVHGGGPSGCNGPTASTPATFAVTVTLDGSGSVASDPEGISCGTDCSESYDEGTEVVLTATASEDFVFSGWSGGDCSGTGTCALTVAAETAVTAAFEEFGKIVFESVRSVDGSDLLNTNEVTNIWSVNSDGTGLLALTVYTGAEAFTSNPVWSPDGTKVAYSSQAAFDGSNAANVNSVHNIWTVNADGSGKTALTQLTDANAESFNPWYSPDGAKIVFWSARALNGSDAANTNNTFNIWVMDADGSDPAPLTSLTAASASAVEPVWSPDGTQILYRSRQALNGSDAANTNNTSNLWVMDADGGGETPLTSLVGSGPVVVDPAWSPDGSRIAFRANRDLNGTDAPNTNNTFNIWVMNADGSDETALTTLTAASTFTGAPQWSPDGTQIIFQSARALDGSDAANDVANIWVMNADGTEQAPLTRLTASGFGPSQPQWSTHGTKIIYHSGQAFDGTDTPNTNSTTNIWIMDADGSDPEPLTDTTAQDAQVTLPQWSR